MTVYCYGRFRIPTAGHDKLFAASDAVVCSKSPSAYHQSLLAEYSGKDVVNVSQGSLLDWAQDNMRYAGEDVLVLGADNVKLGQRLEELGFCVKYIDRQPTDPSSTQTRRELIAFASDSDLVAMGLQASLHKAAIARMLWAAGY